MLQIAIDPPPSFVPTPGQTVSVDLYTGFDDADFISIGLPNFPLPSVDLSQSFVKFSTNPNGVIDGTTNTASIPFTANINPWVNGNVELRFPRSLLFTGLVGQARINALKSVTGVSFVVQATANVTFRVLSFRLVGKNWQYPALDIDTRYQRMESPPPPDGSLGGTPAFPSSVVNGMTTKFPILYWADDPPGKADPRPVNTKVTTAFNTGSLTSATGISNNAAKFNLPGAVLIGDYANLRVSNAFTLEAWIKPDNLSTTRAIVTKWQDTASKRGYRLAVTTAGELQLQYSTDGTTTTTVTSSGAAISTSTWQHVAVTFQITGSGGVSLPLLITSSGANTATVNFYKNGIGVGGQSGLPGPSVFNTTLTNQVSNPSFENNTTGWLAWFQSGTPTRTTVQAAVGAASASVTAPNPAQTYTGLNSPFTPTPGHSYSGGIWVRVVNSGNYHLTLQDAGSVGTATSVSTALTANTWAFITTPLATLHPSHIGTFVFALIREGGPTYNAGEVDFFDGAIILDGTVVNGYFDGDTFNCTWTGTPGSSTSVQHVPFKIGAWNTG